MIDAKTNFVFYPYTSDLVVTNDLPAISFAKTAILANINMCENYPRIYLSASVQTEGILIRVSPTTKSDLQYNNTILPKPNLFKSFLIKLQLSIDSSLRMERHQSRQKQKLFNQQPLSTTYYYI